MLQTSSTAVKPCRIRYLDLFYIGKGEINWWAISLISILFL